MDRATVTIKDVAKKARVSVGTASRAINKKGYIKEATSRRILRAAKELNYTPNFHARSLITKSTEIIGLVVPGIENPHYAGMLTGVQFAAREKGYQCILCSSNDDPKEEQLILEKMRKLHVDGIIMGGGEECSSEDTNKALLEMYENGFPIILSSPRKGLDNLDLVRFDNVKGVETMIEHLISQGHKKIAYIGGEGHLIVQQERLKGYKLALMEKNIGFRKDYVSEAGSFKRDLAYEAAKKILNLQRRPTAIFAANDVMAIGAMEAALDMGFKVPEDIAIAGFDDIPLASMVRPRLTTMRQPMYEFGRTLVNLLMERIQIEPPSPVKREVVLSTQKMIRGSA